MPNLSFQLERRGTAAEIRRMKGLLRTLIFVWAVLAIGSAAVFAEDVVVIPIKGEISKAKFFFLRRALKEAASENAKAVVLDMDTYGGDADAAVEMQKALVKVKVPTFTYVNPNAASAGALIAVSTQHIYMAPISAIGAAAPVAATGENLPETLNAKQVSYLSDYFGSVAEKNGYNPDIVKAFIDKNHPVIVGGQTIHEKGSLLTLGAQQAAKQVDGKPLLAAGIAESIPDLLKQAGIAGRVQEVQPTKFEEVAFWITTLAPLFLLGGILGAWIEIKTPGFGLPGILSAVCFALFFTGHFIAGLAGWEAPVIFAIGLALVISELVIHPGTILPGLAGVFLMLASIFWAMVDRFPGQSLIPESQALERPLLNLGITAVLATVSIALLARYLPRTSVYRRLVLATQTPVGPAFPTEHSEFAGLAVGAEGVAATILRPSGKGTFGGESRDVISRGDFIEPGTPIRIVFIEGSRVVVQRVG